MSEANYHDFYAPIDGEAERFTIRCCDGAVTKIRPTPLIPGDTLRRFAVLGYLELINHLLMSLPWAALVSCKGTGNICAIIEAAEARRFEIYGPLKSERPAA